MKEREKDTFAGYDTYDTNTFKCRCWWAALARVSHGRIAGVRRQHRVGSDDNRQRTLLMLIKKKMVVFDEYAIAVDDKTLMKMYRFY